MKFIDLFAGIGGFRYGLEAVNNEYARLGKKPEQKERTQGRKRATNKRQTQLRNRNKSPFRCVYSNEWDKYASQIYKKHYGECDTTDITKVKEIPDHDLLCAGFPCQSFSIAGKRKGFDDTRGTLFFEIARIAADKKPKYLLLENVKGLLSHDKGRTFQTILGVLSDLGYGVEWQVLNSKHFGVPQNRERVFIIGHLGGIGRGKVFPIGESNEENVSSEQKINQLNQPIHSNDRIYGKDGVSPSLNTAQGGRRQPKVFMLGEHRTELGKRTRREIRKKEGRDSTLRGKNHKEYRPTTVEEANCLTTGKDDVEKWLIDLSTQEAKITKNARSLQARYWKGYSHRKAETSGVLEGTRIRRLTPTECERLQGFPDGWTEGLSDTQRYKCLGNAVTTNVITAIGEKLNTTGNI